jgi:hypothetical protein
LVAIYRTALTPAEIGDNYLAGPNRAPPAKPNGTGYVTLAWDANTEPDLANYKIYYGHEPENYKWSILVGAADQKANRDPGCPDPYDPFKVECCEYTLKGLNEGQTYYLAATALDEDDNESAYSEELIHTVEFKQPGQGTNLRYKDVKLFFKWSSPIIHELLEPKE